MGDWRSYDEIAQRYDEVCAPRFETAARHVWALVAPEPGQRVLDIGTGTGIVPRSLGERAADLALLVGCDRSPEMLSRARERTPCLRLVGADAASLPFPSDTFHLATAGFVLSHVPDYRRALAEAARVLTRPAVLAVTSWAPASDPYLGAWNDLLAGALSREAVERAVAEVVPWEARLSDPANLEAALAEAGLSGIKVEAVDLEFTFSVPQYLADRALSSGGRFARHVLGPEPWRRFLEGGGRELERRFGSEVSYTRGVLIAVGRKP